MLIGIPPFYHQNKKKMFNLIKEAELIFPHQIKISDSAKDLLKKVKFFNFYIFFYS